MSPTNYNIIQPNDASGPCPHCGGQEGGCRFCRKMTCPHCAGIITGDSEGCPTCTGTKHEFTSDLIQHHSVSLPDPTTRPYAGEHHSPNPSIRLSRHR